MKKFVVVSVFIAGIISTSFSQSRQSSISHTFTQMATSIQIDGKGTIKYANGDKYVGEYIKTKTHPTMKRVPYGKGVKTCVNGDRMEGEWRSNQFVYGIWQFANGDLFEGSCNNNYPQRGTYTFVAKGTLQINNVQWTYPANTQFRGDFALGIPESGEYNKPLISEEGHIYTGKLLKKEFDNGVMQFPNGDIFKGSFVRNKCYIGDYKYASDTTIKGDGYHWIIPAGCTFTGTVTTLTGCVDKIIRDNEGDQYLGNLKHGKPHGQGSMTYANGQVETGEWVDGMSPTKYQEYLAEQEAERQRKEAEQKRKQELYDAKCLKMFEEHLASKSKKDNYYSTIWLPWENEEIHRGGLLKLCQLLNGRDLKWGNIPYARNITATMDTEKHITISYQDAKTGKQCTGSIESAICLERSRPKIGIPYPAEFPIELYEHKYLCGLNGTACVYTICDIDKIEHQKQAAVAKAERWVRNYCIRKFGQSYGTAVINRQVKLGMTVEMIQTIHEREGSIRRYISQNGEVITLTFSSGWLSGTEYTFINGRLREYTSY